MTLCKTCSRKFDPSRKVAVVNEGYGHYINMKKFFKKKSSPPKPLNHFEPNLAGMFLGRSSSKMFTDFDSFKDSVAMATNRDFVSYSLKIFSSGTTGQSLKYFHRSVPWRNLFKICSRNFDPSINMSLVNGGYLPYVDMKKFLENLL